MYTALQQLVPDLLSLTVSIEVVAFLIQYGIFRSIIGRRLRSVPAATSLQAQ